MTATASKAAPFRGSVPRKGPDCPSPSPRMLGRSRSSSPSSNRGPQSSGFNWSISRASRNRNRWSLNCALVDAPPEVVLREPISDLIVTPDATIPLKFELRDDYGLVSTLLEWQRESDPAGTKPLAAWTDRPLTHLGEAEWELADLQLKTESGSSIASMPPTPAMSVAPHVGRSAAGR